MKNLRFRLFLSAICLASVLIGAIQSNAAPVQFNQVLQIVNAKPGKANTGGFVGLRLADDNLIFDDGDDDKKKAAPQQDDRVIVETRAEIVEDDVCDCELPAVTNRRFPYPLLALGAIPLLFLIPRGRDKPPPTPSVIVTPTPTPGMTPTLTPPGMTPTPTPPGMTPTPTPPGMTPTPTPPMTPTPAMTPTPPGMTPTPTPPGMTPTPPMTTPTPPTEPVPEPMTILLFGTGLASIGLAARKKFGKKKDDETDE